MPEKKVCLVVGAGDGTGAAIAEKFAREGYATCVVRRERHLDKLDALVEKIHRQGGEAHGFGIDARNEEQVVQLFNAIESDVGQLEVVVFNIGANVWFPITETTSRVFQKVWELACFAGFLAGREAAARMAPRKQGSIFFTGATASIRGGSHFAAFASAKNGLRALAQSMARELGPQGIHVAHLVIDGAIDTPWIRETFPDKFDGSRVDNVLNPEDIADAYWMLHQQKRSAWTHELDLRPWVEKW
ncbi:MAG: SDR family oxidoreductase [bacterium]